MYTSHQCVISSLYCKSNIWDTLSVQGRFHDHFCLVALNTNFYFWVPTVMRLWNNIFSTTNLLPVRMYERFPIIFYIVFSDFILLFTKDQGNCCLMEYLQSPIRSMFIYVEWLQYFDLHLEQTPIFIVERQVLHRQTCRSHGTHVLLALWICNHTHIHRTTIDMITRPHDYSSGWVTTTYRKQGNAIIYQDPNFR